MSDQEIFDKLLAIVKEATELSNLDNEITMDTNILKDLNINSMSMLYIAMAIEETFGVKIKNDDLMHNVTVKDWINYLRASE